MDTLSAKVVFTLAKAKASREIHRQLGQFLTPLSLAERIVEQLDLHADSRILEPSFGDGSFLIPLVRRLLPLHRGTLEERLATVLTENLWGVEIDPRLRSRALDRIEAEFACLPDRHNLTLGDFFKVEYMVDSFDCIVGNPPYGGTFDPSIEDRLDKVYGTWNGHKLKKETYSFFIAKSLDLLAPPGSLNFIASDTFLTINTMSGLRRKLLDLCAVKIERLPSFSEETTQPTLVLHACKTGRAEELRIEDSTLSRSIVELTGNFSWGVDSSVSHYFSDRTLGDVIVASSGMTIGKNELFLRAIEDGQINEESEFIFFDEPISLERELERARLNRLSPRQQGRILELEQSGATRRNVKVEPRPDGPAIVRLPHPDYRYYNKAERGIVYVPPKWVVYWRDEGDAVLTFKKNGNWYLHGVGGQKFFGKEGLTWQLIASKLNMRYLPAGYILDSGAPCAFLRPGVDRSELWFVLGWCLTSEASRVLKTAINHTRNIQSKDVERMPYPHWVAPEVKAEVVGLVESMLEQARMNREFNRESAEVRKLDKMFVFQ